jgi:hypothetical protein
MQLRLNGADPGEDSAMLREKRQRAIALGMRRGRNQGLWGPGDEERECLRFAERLVTELFFSSTRQMMEVEALLAGIDAAFNGVVKFMRVRSLVDEIPQRVSATIRLMLKAQRMVGGEGGLHHDPDCMSLIFACEALGVYHNLAPVSEYFSNVPMTDEVATYYTRRCAEIEAKNFDVDRRQPSDISVLRQFQFHDAESESVATNAMRDYARLLSATVADFRARRGLVRPAVTRWDSATWKQRQKGITSLYARTLVRAWKNLQTHCTSVEAADNLSFGRIALALVYLTKSSLTVQDTSVAPCESHVTVVPAIDFSHLLPCDNQLGHFNLDEFAAATGAKRLTTVQGDIRSECLNISKAGKLQSMLLRLEDEALLVP